MSRLAFYGRPWIVFDAYNKQHREWFAEFQARRSWSRCPVRFIIDDENGDLLTMIQRRLIEYYTDREFGNTKTLRDVEKYLEEGKERARKDLQNHLTLIKE
ncbi:hypothetical protein EBY67_03525 [bacterium]|jgi:hypothetical protein|nr:hypothetical protein [Verrucomicrobiota bacterium]NDH86110.1 hypothetical protein [bacterium]